MWQHSDLQAEDGQFDVWFIGMISVVHVGKALHNKLLNELRLLTYCTLVTLLQTESSTQTNTTVQREDRNNGFNNTYSTYVFNRARNFQSFLSPPYKAHYT